MRTDLGIMTDYMVSCYKKGVCSVCKYKIIIILMTCVWIETIDKETIDNFKYH